MSGDMRGTLVGVLQKLLVARDKLSCGDYPDSEVGESIRMLTKQLEEGWPTANPNPPMFDPSKCTCKPGDGRCTSGWCEDQGETLRIQ